MTLSNRYLVAVGRLPEMMKKIREGTAPERFTVQHLKNLGFTSSNDRAFIPLLKDLGFLDPEGTPTERYHQYRNTARSRRVLGEALTEAYEDIFHINANPTEADRDAVQGLFKSIHNVSDHVAQLQAATFYNLLELADILLDHAEETIEVEATPPKQPEEVVREEKKAAPSIVKDGLQLTYSIEIHLPPTKDIEVYNAIFKSIREYLLE